MSSKPDNVNAYEKGQGPIQTLTYWGVIGAMLGSITAIILGRSRFGVLLGLIGGLIVGVFQLRDD